MKDTKGLYDQISELPRCRVSALFPAPRRWILWFYQAYFSLSTVENPRTIAYKRADFITRFAAMKIKPLQLYSLAAIFQIAGSSGAAMLAPFFMKDHGYSIAAASVPLVVNGIGRVCSDLTSGVMASYFSSGVLIVAASAASIMIAPRRIFLLSRRSYSLARSRFSASPKRCLPSRSEKLPSSDPNPANRARPRPSGRRPRHRLFPRTAARRDSSANASARRHCSFLRAPQVIG